MVIVESLPLSAPEVPFHRCNLDMSCRVSGMGRFVGGLEHGVMGSIPLKVRNFPKSPVRIFRHLVRLASATVSRDPEPSAAGLAVVTIE